MRAGRYLVVDRTSSGEAFAAVERQFFEQGLKLEAEIAFESEAMKDAAEQPEGGSRRRKQPSLMGKVVVLVVVVAGVSFIGHRWFAGGAGPTPVAVADHAATR